MRCSSIPAIWYIKLPDLSHIQVLTSKLGSGTHVLGEWDNGFVDESPRDLDGTLITIPTSEKDVEEDDNYPLFPPRLLGYATREKVWGQFAVDHTNLPPGKKTSKFQNDLQLDQKYKDIIEALVASHESNQETKQDKEQQVRDVVQNKGKGLVLLLHGILLIDQI